MSGSAPELERSASPRREWMDVLRGTAVALVVVLHAVALVSLFRAEPFAGSATLMEALAPLRLPMLFLLSGLLVPRSLTKGPRRYLSGKLAKVLHPYVVWTLILTALAALIPGSLMEPDLLGQLVFPRTPLWFLAFLFVYYLMALAFRRLPPLLVAAAALVCAAVPIEGEWYEFWTRAIAFFVGVAIGEHVDTVEAIARRRWLGAALFGAALTATIARVYFGVGYSDPLTGTVVALAFFLGATSLVLPFASAPVLTPVRFVGRRTLPLYVSHWPFIEYTILPIAVNTALGPRGLLAIAVTVGFAGPIALMLLAERVPGMGWLFEWRPRTSRRTAVGASGAQSSATATD